MEKKKYLKWYNKIGYGSGDIAGNIVYAFLTSFVMVYLTDTIGLASGIVGTLIAVSKLLDGFTDIFFGSMIVCCQFSRENFDCPDKIFIFSGNLLWLSSVLYYPFTNGINSN